MKQLEIFAYKEMNTHELSGIIVTVRNAYWHVRNLRKGKFGQARLRHYYRLIEKEKLKMRLAGSSKRDVLDLMKCCRLKCSRSMQPFEPCRFCPGKPIEEMLPNI